MAEQRKHMGKDAPDIIIPIAPTLSEMDQSYASFIERLKETVSSTKVKITLQANAQLITIYWRIGRMILDAQEKEGWGARVIDRITRDLRESFPDMKGFSASKHLGVALLVAAAFPSLGEVRSPLALRVVHNSPIVSPG